jgi:hypothetical protein
MPQQMGPAITERSVAIRNRGDVRRFGAIGDDINNDAIAAALCEASGGRYTVFAPGRTHRMQPTDVSPYYFGNAPATLVYAAVQLGESNYTVDGNGSTLHIVSRAGIAGSGDYQYVYASDKNLVLGTQKHLRFRGVVLDVQNDLDAVNSNHRGYYMTGVDDLRFENCKGFSSGNRRGTGGNIQNCRNVLISAYTSYKQTQAWTFRYTQNVCVVGFVGYDFSELLDLDGTQERTVVCGATVESTNRTCQAMDINGQRDGVFIGMTFHNVGQLMNISHKATTPDNFADYVAGAAVTTKLPSQRVIYGLATGTAIGGTASVCKSVGNDWSDGGHAGFEGPHDVLFIGEMYEDVSYMMVWECDRLTIRDLYLGAVITAASFYAVNLTSLVGTGDQRAWSTLTGMIDGLVVNGAQRGGLRVMNARSMHIRSAVIRGINSLGGSDFAVQLSGLHERGAQIRIDGLDIDASGNVQINGNSASIAAWAATTTYRKSQVVGNGTPVVYYRAVSETGISAGAGGPTGTGSAIVDGTVTWEHIGEPFTVIWGANNRLAAGSIIQFSGDAHKYTHGQLHTARLGDIAATGSLQKILYTATRKCYVTRAAWSVNANVAADATNFRTIIFRSLTAALGTTSISSFTTAAGATAYVEQDGGFAANETGAYLMPGDSVYLDTSSTLAGKALPDLTVSLDVLPC